MADIKTETQIEKDIFRIVSASPIKDLIGGKVYRRGMRPRDSKEEDCVVQFLTGLEGQIQSGTVNVNIYVPKVSVGKSTNKVENLKRVEELEIKIKELFEESVFEDPEYNLEIRSTPQAIEEEGIDQTKINTRVYYERSAM
jgi:hypothetical protein